MASGKPTFLQAISKTKARLRTRGAREIVQNFWGGLRGAVRTDDELIFLVRSAAWSGDVVRRTDEPLHLARATPKDGPDYERYIGTDSAATFSARLSDSTSCWLIRGRGIVLHATWTTTGAAWTSEVDRFFVPPAGGAYIYESFTRPEARGLGVYPFALVEIGHVLSGEGIETLLVGVEAGNAPSIRAITKAGFEPAFTIGLHRRWGRVRLDEPSGPRPELASSCLHRQVPDRGSGFKRGKR
jgi:hypothetical protein